MKYRILKLITLFLLVAGLSGLHAQESVNATGGDASGSGGSASYSVGEIVYTTLPGTGGSVAEGVQQPFEISVVTGLEQININLTFSVYPNPTTGYLNLEVETDNWIDLSFQLFDIQGKLLDTEKITSIQTSIDMSFFVSGTYFVKVTHHDKEIKTYKIIKN
jgi:hypothetical protein